VGIRSNAHFGVKEQVLDAVVRELRDALEVNFPATHYGVSEVLVQREDDDSFVIQLKMVSGDAEEADVDAERAVEAIKEILDKHFERGSVRERQRELTLA
jgi:isopentenyl diphosphate isomerase/L-lactate dehydrogenase-like FMN-dependent dehydrogenase